MILPERIDWWWDFLLGAVAGAAIVLTIMAVDEFLHTDNPKVKAIRETGTLIVLVAVVAVIAVVCVAYLGAFIREALA